MTFAVHRTGIASHLVDIDTIVDSSSGKSDEAMSAYQKKLLAMPNIETLSPTQFISLWNNSSATNQDRPRLGSLDDILIFDSIISELKPYLDTNSPTPFFTEYYARFKCVYCERKITLDTFDEKTFRTVPLLSPSANGRIISAGQCCHELFKFPSMIQI